MSSAKDLTPNMKVTELCQKGNHEDSPNGCIGRLPKKSWQKDRGYPCQCDCHKPGARLWRAFKKETIAHALS